MNQDTEKISVSSNKTSIFKKVALAFAVFFLLLTFSAAIFYWLAGGSFDNPRGSKTALAVQDGDNNPNDYGNYPNKVNILVLGVDNRTEDTGRSDTMFVVMLDTKTKQVSLLSVPRDTRTLIPGIGWDKINHAFAHGGVKLSKRAVEGLLGIPINYYACINFDGFYKIIDSLGGVTINVEKRMYYEDPYDDLVIDLYPGSQKLTGRRAIHYVRYRDEEGDIGRIGRQQKFISAMMQQAASPLTLTRLPSIIRDAFSSVDTDMTVSETVGLAKLLREAADNGLKTEMVRGTPTFIDGVDYWIPDIMDLRAHIAKAQGISSDPKWLTAAKAQARQNYASIPADAEFDETPFWLTDGGYVADSAAAPQKPKDDDAKDDDGDTKKSDKSKQNDQNDKPKPPNKLTQTDKSQQPDKPKQPAVASTPPAKESAAAKSDETKKPAAKTTGTLRVSIVNASGSAEAADKMAAAMRRQGFEVSGVTTSPSTNPNTTVIANTSDSSVTGKLTALPFRYALRINDDPARANQVTVIIGMDYLRS